MEENNKKLKVGIYCRVSKADNSQTNENQKPDLIRWCESMGFDYTIFEEKESSRKTRPVKNQVFQEAIQKKWDMILVWKLDRWARSLQELINDLEILKENKIQFYSFKDNIKLSDNPIDKLMIHILGAFSEFERGLIKERTKTALKRIDEEIKEKGFYVSKAGNRISQRGRPAGAKDLKRRKRLGYFTRYSKAKDSRWQEPTVVA